MNARPSTAVTAAGKILPVISFATSVLFQHLLTTQHRPLLASYKLTYQCNLACTQCPFIQYSGPTPSFELVCQSLDALYRRGNQLVVFEGGEPLLWRDGKHDLQDVVKYAKQLFACVALTTNGTLPLDIDTDVLWVSIDGFAETHNHLRQAPIFERVIDHIKASRHPHLYAHITANAENAAEIPELVRFLSGLVKGITIQFYYPYGTNDRLYLSNPQRSALLEHLIGLKKDGYPILNSIPALRAVQTGRWRCLPWLVDCVNPDGRISQGCYLQGRVEIDCSKCGFTPYTEISMAFQGNPRAILAGMRIFI